MKLFWKIFFTTMFVGVACLALGGYLLIHSNLRTLLENEAQMAYDYGDMVYYALANELKTTQTTSAYSQAPSQAEDAFLTVGQVASAININNMDQKVPFSVLGHDGKIVFSSLTQAFDKNILLSLGQQQKGWALKKEGRAVYLQAVRPALYQSSTFYIETARDVTYAFSSQRDQYQTLLKITLGMILVAGLFTFAVSKLLIKRVVLLSKVTRDIASGALGKRAPVDGGDEITALSENFNRMADDLEQKICALQEEANKKDLFVGAFSHELKTPLTSIIGYSDMLRRKEMPKEQRHLCAEYIFSEGKRLEHLSMRLMDLIVLKNQELRLEPVHIEPLLREVCAAFSPQLRELGITVRCDIEPAVIPMERDLMKTVFINLLNNGKKAIDTNGHMMITGKRTEDRYMLGVHDTGKGIEPQDLSKIKEAFYMADKSRARKQGGVGLGLAICDEILKLHGFGIAFNSVVGAGTTVTVTMKGAKND